MKPNNMKANFLHRLFLICICSMSSVAASACTSVSFMLNSAMQVNFIILDSQGNPYFSGTLTSGNNSDTHCLDGDCYSFVVTSQTGAGSVTFFGANGSTVTMGLDLMPYSFSVGSTVCGCTDPTACGYNPAATIDDGTCDYSLLPIALYLQNTSGSASMNVTFTEESGTLSSSAVPAGGIFNLPVCLPEGCFTANFRDSMLVMSSPLLTRVMFCLLLDSMDPARCAS